MDRDDAIDWHLMATKWETRAKELLCQRNGLQEVYERALLWKHRYQDALDKITKHPDCHRLIMQIACEALRGGVEREE